MRFLDATPLPARRQPPVRRRRSGACGAPLEPRLPGRGVRAPGSGSARERRLAVRLCKGSRRRRRAVATHVAVAFATGRRHVPAGVNPKGPRHAADGRRAPRRAPRVSPPPAWARIIAQMRAWAQDPSFARRRARRYGRYGFPNARTAGEPRLAMDMRRAPPGQRRAPGEKEGHARARVEPRIRYRMGITRATSRLVGSGRSHLGRPSARARTAPWLRGEARGQRRGGARSDCPSAGFRIVPADPAVLPARQRRSASPEEGCSQWETGVDSVGQRQVCFWRSTCPPWVAPWAP